MTIEQLQYFVYIAETGSFSKTAEQLNISQSSVTKRLQALEIEWGAILFDRDNRHVALSETGKALYPKAVEILRRIEKIQLEAEELAGAGCNSIRIASLPILGQYNLLEKLNRFEAQYPNATILLDEQEDETIQEALKSRKCDAAIMRGQILPRRDYETFLLAQDRLVLAVVSNHPLAAKESVDIRQLQRERLMLMPRYTEVCRLSSDACLANGFHPNIVQYARVETILSNVKSGRCVALLMEQALEVFRSEQIRVVPITPQINSAIVLAVPKNTAKKPLLRALIRCFTQKA